MTIRTKMSILLPLPNSLQFHFPVLRVLFSVLTSATVHVTIKYTHLIFIIQKDSYADKIMKNEHLYIMEMKQKMTVDRFFPVHSDFFTTKNFPNEITAGLL